MITPAQCRGARALLDITQSELAEMAGLGESTIRDFEAERRTPHPDSLAAMVLAFQTADIEFMAASEPSATGGPGLRFRSDSMRKRR